MKLSRRGTLAGLASAAALASPKSLLAQPTPRRGGTLRVYHRDSPASMSLLEETTISVIAPMLAVFNNLVVFDPHVPQNSMSSIIPELATEWRWTEDGRRLDFTLRNGVAWHDGKPFTATDVVHTWDLLLGKASEKLRVNPRASWYANVQAVTADGADRVSFHLSRPQPALLQLLASGGAPIYPAHIPPAHMRTNPIGTGPFRFAEYKRGENIRFVRNDHYWKPDRPYLDGIDWTIIPNRATAILGFVSGRFDLTFPYEVSMPLLKDVLAQVPNVQYAIAPTGVAGNVTLNHTVPPFDNPQIRQALALALDRAEFIRIMTDGKGLIGGAMMPPPNGVWGLTPEQLAAIPFYQSDMDSRRSKARQIMAAQGYGPEKHLAVMVSARNLPDYRDAAVILIDQMRTIWIDGTLDPVDTAVWDAKMIRKNYTVAFNQTGTAVDEPDINLFENYHCGSSRNFAGYCDPEMEQHFIAQSLEPDQAKRREMVRAIDAALQTDAVRPIMYHNVAATCWYPRLHGLTLTTNSMYNGWRMEEAWLEA